MAEPLTIRIDDAEVKRLCADLPAKLTQEVAYKAVSAITADTE
jgi:hypothetical protein